MKLRGIQLMDRFALISSSLESESIGVLCLIPSSSIMYVVDQMSPPDWGFLINWFYFFGGSRMNFPTCRSLKEPSRTKKSQGEVLRSCTWLQCPIQCHHRVQHRRGPLCPKNPTNFSQMAGFKEIQRRQNVTWEWSLIVVDKASI